MASVTETARAIVDLDGKAAGEKIKELRKQAKDLKEELKQLKISGDKTGFEAKKRELDGINKKLDEARRSTWDLQKVMQNLNGTSLKDLERAQRQLTNEVRNATRATEEDRRALKAKAEQLSAVKNQIQQVKTETGLASKTNQSFFAGMSNSFNKYFGIVTAFAASITGMVLGFRKLAEQVAHMDDVYSDVMKTTGMTRDAVVDLNEELKKIDTRTSRESLNLLARDAGKLGINGKKDILDFIEAGNQINVALGEDLGDDAIKNIGKMVGVYKDASTELQNLGLKEQMLAVGSAVNQLGASSTASEPFLVAFAGRLGGIAKQAGISMSSILGFGSALDQDMQAVEMSATALQNFIMKLMGDPAKFAKLAGLEVKSFTKLLSTDANAAIVQVLTSLNQKGGFQQLIPLFQEMGLDGARAVGVLSSMAGSIDKVTTAQDIANRAMLENTSITDEYNIKNNNLAAQLDKARKKFFENALALGEKLSPALTVSINSFSYLIKGVMTAIRVFNENRSVILSTLSAIAAYTVVVHGATAAKKIYTTVVNFATAAVKAFNLASKMSPLGLIAAALAFAATSWITYKEQIKKTTKEQDTFNDIQAETKRRMVEEVGEMKRLFDVLRDQNTSQEVRSGLIKEINEKYKDYLPNLLTEESSLADINTAYINVNKAMKEKIEFMVKESKAKEIYLKIYELELEFQRIAAQTAAEFNKENGIVEGVRGAARGRALQSLREDMKELSGIYDKIMTDISSVNGDPLNTSGKISNTDDDTSDKPVKDLKTAYQQLGEEISIAEQKLQDFILTGSTEDMLGAGKTVEQLRAAKKYIDEIIAANGDLESVIDKVRLATSDEGIKKNNADINADIDTSIAGDLAYLDANINPVETNLSPLENKKQEFDKDFYLQSIETTSSAAFDIWKAQTDARLDYDIQALNSAMEKELSNKHLTEDQKDKIRQKYAKREKALKIEAFKKQKAADIIQSIINTALAVTKALPNVPLSIAAGIAGAAQTAVIAAQPIPAFYAGGDTGKGIGLTDQYGAVAGVVHANEYVVPEWMRGIPQVMAFERIMEGIRTSRGYAGGGNVTNTSTVVNNQAAPAMGADPLLISVINRLNDNIEKGIRSKLVLQEFEEFTDKHTLIEQESGF